MTDFKHLYRNGKERKLVYSPYANIVCNSHSYAGFAKIPNYLLTECTLLFGYGSIVSKLKIYQFYQLGTGVHCYKLSAVILNVTMIN